MKRKTPRRTSVSYPGIRQTVSSIRLLAETRIHLIHDPSSACISASAQSNHKSTPHLQPICRTGTSVSPIIHLHPSPKPPQFWPRPRPRRPLQQLQSLRLPFKKQIKTEIPLHTKLRFLLTGQQLEQQWGREFRCISRVILTRKWWVIS